MTRISWRLVEALSRMLAPDERDAVRGDLAERSSTGVQALGDVFGLVVRRQAALWRDWRPWLALVALVLPLGPILTLASRRTADGSAIFIWMYANNWDYALFGNSAFAYDFARACAGVLTTWLALICWSWTNGLTIGFLSRRAIAVNGGLFCLLLLLMELPGAPLHLAYLPVLSRGRDFSGNAAVFSLAFYRVAFPLIVQAALVFLPALCGMRHGLRMARHWSWRQAILWAATLATFAGLAVQIWILRRFPASTWPAPGSGWQTRLVQLAVYWPVVYLGVRVIRRRWRGKAVQAAALLLTLAGIAGAADPSAVRAVLQPAAERKPAPEFALKDRSGKTVTLKKYRGKVVLLDFWATWCHGCKEEIPWFSEFQRKYSAKGLTVVGISLDDDGWKVVTPFLKTARLPYRIVLGDDPTAQKYGIGNMPDTFLIDRQGRIAAAYSGLVDKDDVETNIRAMLSQR
jgi:peroxiredoxin